MLRRQREDNRQKNTFQITVHFRCLLIVLFCCFSLFPMSLMLLSFVCQLYLKQLLILSPFPQYALLSLRQAFFYVRVWLSDPHPIYSMYPWVNGSCCSLCARKSQLQIAFSVTLMMTELQESLLVFPVLLWFNSFKS